MPVLENPRHELYAQGVAKGLTSIDAYRRAGYSRSRKGATLVKGKPDVQRRVRELIEAGARRAEVSVEKVLRELARIGFADVRQLHDINGRLLQIAELSDDIAAAVASYEVVRRVTSKPAATKGGGDKDAQDRDDDKAEAASVEEFTHRIKVWDKARALDMIGRYLAMFADRQRKAGDESAPVVEVEDVRRRFLDEVDRIAARLGAAAADRQPE